jgi:hypothetical protein
MIRYALACAKGHGFDSWFQSSAAFDRQAKRGLITCPVCGSSKVDKAIMSPNIARARKRKPGADPKPAPETAAATAPVAMISPQERELRRKLRELRDHVTKSADFVGRKFPEEARKMHYGEAEHRSIYGEASPQQAKELHEEGIEFYPLPTLPDEQN